MRTLDTDIPCIKVVRLPSLDTMPMETFKIILKEEGEAVVRVKYVYVFGSEPRTLVTHPGDMVGERLGLIQGFTAAPDNALCEQWLRI